MKITEQNYVDEAERVIKKLCQKKDKNGKPVIVSTSKLRNLLSMTADIYNEVMRQTSQELAEDICNRITYLRVRFIYESGRDENVRDLVEQAELLDCLQEIKGERKRYILFSRYMEALVAFRKYHAGND